MTPSTEPRGDTPGQAETPRPADGPPTWFAALAIGGIVLGAVLIVLQLIGISVMNPGPAATLPPTGLPAQRTWDQAASALGAQGFQVQEPQAPYRPGEIASLVDVPRKLLQVVLPSEPQGAYVVIYELPSNDDAERVGHEFAQYLVSGPGAVQYPRDAQFVVQRVGQTLIFFPWSGEANHDPRLPVLAAALETLGTSVVP